MFRSKQTSERGGAWVVRNWGFKFTKLDDINFDMLISDQSPSHKLFKTMFLMSRRKTFKVTRNYQLCTVAGQRPSLAVPVGMDPAKIPPSQWAQGSWKPREDGGMQPQCVRHWPWLPSTVDAPGGRNLGCLWQAPQWFLFVIFPFRFLGSTTQMLVYDEVKINSRGSDLK